MDPLKYAVSYSCHFIFAFVLGIPHTTTVTLNPFLASNSQNWAMDAKAVDNLCAL